MLANRMWNRRWAWHGTLTHLQRLGCGNYCTSFSKAEQEKLKLVEKCKIEEAFEMNIQNV